MKKILVLMLMAAAIGSVPAFAENAVDVQAAAIYSNEQVEPILTDKEMKMIYKNYKKNITSTLRSVRIKNYPNLQILNYHMVINSDGSINELKITSKNCRDSFYKMVVPQVKALKFAPIPVVFETDTYTVDFQLRSNYTQVCNYPSIHYISYPKRIRLAK